MKTNKIMALVSVLTLAVATQPVYGMEHIKERLTASRVAKYASAVTFMGLVTGNKKWVVAGGCALSLALMTPEQRLKLAQVAVQNWQTIIKALSFASLCYYLLSANDILQGHNSSDESEQETEEL